MHKDEIKFLREKSYKWIEDLGQGGCGKTILIEDDLIDEKFACKKKVQYLPSIGNAFIKGGYTYNKKTPIKILTLKKFVDFFKSRSIDKKRIILNNIWSRLDTIEREDSLLDDMPF